MLRGVKHNPRFKPSANYSLGETSGGCSLTSGKICDRDNRRSDIFLKLSKMKVGNQTCTPTSFSEGNCTDQCLNDCHCVAYSDGYAGCSLTGTSTVNKCLKWSDKLTDLQEDYEHGITIFVRTTRSDIDPTSRGCSPCGTSIIPYPLSTGRNCGDPWYFNFQCNAVTGQLNFLTQSSNFRVTKIDPDANIFSIQVMHASCDSRYINSSVLSPNRSSPFTARDCRVKFQPLAQVDRPSIEVDISWRPPLEFSCNTPSDCIQWPNTRCKRTNEGKMRCICRPKYNWNGTKLECIHRKRVLFPPKIAVPSIAGASAIFLVCFIYLVYVIRKRRIAHKQDMFEFKGDDSEAIDVPFFDWEVILAATNNFADANRLGIGGFGSVYMGKLLDGQQIAVKRLSSVSVQGVEEFRTEVVLIAKLQHRNLVKLLGYCMKSEEKILVYEFMPNGSLDACLFDEKHSVYLDWKKHFDIIVGIARGLLYLHQDSRLRIIHRDLKPSNILLDEELNPKISDFGIARIVGGKDTQASTGRVVGTYGYMSPEYAYEGIFSIKSDVFSFGVVILETISGRRNSRIFMFEHGLSLLGYIKDWNCWTRNSKNCAFHQKFKSAFISGCCAYKRTQVIAPLCRL